MHSVIFHLKKVKYYFAYEFVIFSLKKKKKAYKNKHFDLKKTTTKQKTTKHIAKTKKEKEKNLGK